MAKKSGFTASHQFLVDVSARGGAALILNKLEQANILCSRMHLPRDYADGVGKESGLRFGTNEVTRLGMGAKEMRVIANFIVRVVIDGEDPLSVSKEVSKFKHSHAKLKYAFA